MTTKQLRELFSRQTLPLSLLVDPTPFYQAFTEGEAEVGGFLTAVWASLCAEQGDTLAAHPFFPEVDFWLVDETEEHFACMLDVYLPAAGPAPALYAALVFGATMDPRYFTGLAAADGGIALVELLYDGGESLQEAACGVLAAQLPEKERRRQFMEQVYTVCDAYSNEN